MKTKKITLTELRNLVVDLIKEEKDLNVKKNKIINILKSKSMGLSHDEAKSLVDSNEDMITQDKDDKKIAIQLKMKHKGS